MKSNYLLLFSFYLILGNFSGIKGMAEQSSKASESVPLVTEQGQIEKFNNLLTERKFERAFELFKTVYPFADVNLKSEYIKIITKIALWEALDPNFSFVNLFLKPIIDIDILLEKDIVNAIMDEYFDKKYPQNLQLFFSQNLDRIINYGPAFRAFVILVVLSKKTIDQIKQEWLKLFFDNMAAIYLTRQHSFGSGSIIKYIGYEIFIEYLAQHIDSIITKQNKFLISLFRDLHWEEKYESKNIKPKITTVKKISEAITQNIMLFNNDPQIKYLFSDNATLLLKDISLQNIIATALSHIKKVSPQFALALLWKSKNPQLARAIITEYSFPEDLKVLAQNILTGDLEASPTMLHLKRYPLVIPVALYKEFQKNPELKDLYSRFMKKETELNKNNYYTFVHGQERRFYFPERLYTHLWGLRKKQSTDNFLFLHVKDLIETPEAQSEEEITRRTIHMAGTIQESDYLKVDIERRKKILFMNYAFFANLGNLGSNSAVYVLKNQNAPAGREIEMSNKDPFTLFGYDLIYKKYQKEIEQLAQDYKNLSKYGNMILIAIPKDKIYKYVYLCSSGGIQAPLRKEDGPDITDIRIAMEALLKDPDSLRDSDQIEFCLIMTQQKGGLDPSTGIQIYPLLSGDPKRLKVLQDREKILLDRITVDIKEAEKQQALQRAAKITGHLVESAPAK